MHLLSYVVLPVIFMIASQDITEKNIVWTSSKLTQLSTGTVSSEPQKLAVYQKERIEWIDGNGTKKYQLAIQSINGNLQLDGQGELLYQVSGENIRGTITIRKTSTVTIFKVIMVEDNKPTIYELVMSSYIIL